MYIEINTTVSYSKDLKISREENTKIQGTEHRGHMERGQTWKMWDDLSHILKEFIHMKMGTDNGALIPGRSISREEAQRFERA